MQMIEAIRHTGITVTDMGLALELYRDLLGLRVVMDNEASGPWFSQVVGLEDARARVVMLEAPDGARLELFEYLSHPEDAPASPRPSKIGCTHVAFRVSHLDALYQKLLDRGYTFDSPPSKTPDGFARVTYGHDADGTIIELVEILDPASAPYAP
jgi:catechol 2,3-dioxygenase-like lactoylglutathione lyase family enzyme